MATPQSSGVFGLDDVPWLKPYTHSAKRKRVRSLLVLLFAVLVPVLVYLVITVGSSVIVAAGPPSFELLGYIGGLLLYIGFVYILSDLFAKSIDPQRAGKCLALSLLLFGGLLVLLHTLVGIWRGSPLGGFLFGSLLFACPCLVLAVLSAWPWKRKEGWRMRFANLSLLAGAGVIVALASVVIVSGVKPTSNEFKRQASPSEEMALAFLAIQFAIAEIGVILNSLLYLLSFVVPSKLRASD